MLIRNWTWQLFLFLPDAILLLPIYYDIDSSFFAFRSNITKRVFFLYRSIFEVFFLPPWIQCRFSWYFEKSSIKNKVYKYQMLKNSFSPDFFEMATFLACKASPNKLPILNQCRVRMRSLFHYSLDPYYCIIPPEQPLLLPVKSYYPLYFSLFLSRGASKAKIVTHWLIVLWIFGSKNFFPKVFFNIFSIFFLSFFIAKFVGNCASID